MSLFFRPKAEERSISSIPWSHGGPRPLMGDSLEGSLSLVPVYSAVNFIATTVSTLPLQAYRKTPNGSQRIPTPKLFQKPDPRLTQTKWVQQGLASALIRGNAFALKVGLDRDEMTPRSTPWLHPDTVELRDDEWFVNGKHVPNENMLHVPGLVLPGSRLGISPLTACRTAIQGGMSAQEFMGDWFTNRAIPGLHFKNEAKVLEPAESAKVKERLKATLRNGEPFVTGKDWSMDVLRIPAEDAGFVASSQLTATQVAAIYGVPPEEIGGETGGSLHYTTEELNQIKVLRRLRHWLVTFEEAFSELLPAPQYLKFNADAGIRVDTATRYGVHKIAREIGLNNIDELRALEDEQPLPGGQGQDYTPLAMPASKETP